MTAAEWNARHPVGTAVRYFPVLGQSGHLDTVTRSEAWEIGSRYEANRIPLVLIKGRSGGVWLGALECKELCKESARTDLEEVHGRR